MKKDILKKSESGLIVKKIYIENMSLQRTQIPNGILRFSESSIKKKFETIDNNQYKCSLALMLSDEDETVILEIVVSGIFEFNAILDNEQKQIILSKNTMAILFPYLRAQATLLTAQPDMEPVVIPAININALLQNLEEE